MQETNFFNWDFNSSLGNDINLLSDGSMLVCLKDNNAAITYGGYGGIFRKINADQSIDWEVSYSSSDYTAHHDVEYLSNGNIIFPAWEELSQTEAAEQGFGGSYSLNPESIIEMNPLTQEIVWEWHAMDHIVQDIDDSKPNYGTVAENPNKIDVNYNYQTRSNGDIMHINGLTLDEENDLLYLTVNNYSEIWVLDHSTSKAEASTNSGGNYGLGGDLIYRFGNPETYDNIGEATLSNVHYPNLLETGNMLAYANDVYGNQSEVVEYELNPPYNLVAGQNNEPNVVWSFTDNDLYSSGLSSAVRMKNGNTLIAEGRDGTLWEVSDDGEVDWLYKTNYATIWRTYVFYSDDPAITALDF
ncbi:aryl-sulfate sulfotransferase [Cyclobacterium qasimii]|uniref:aryl-sulfate sulfotransferase n=1 Tax=Cyclobacterium qasimii TaxID=1350429 RepID=UPI00190FA89E|nr:aryl-sulfate sulfotransferase [Cyclobacterium qasimii]